MPYLGPTKHAADAISSGVETVLVDGYDLRVHQNRLHVGGHVSDVRRHLRISQQRMGDQRFAVAVSAISIVTSPGLMFSVRFSIDQNPDPGSCAAPHPYYNTNRVATGASKKQTVGIDRCRDFASTAIDCQDRITCGSFV